MDVNNINHHSKKWPFYSAYDTFEKFGKTEHNDGTIAEILRTLLHSSGRVRDVDYPKRRYLLKQCTKGALLEMKWSEHRKLHNNKFYNVQTTPRRRTSTLCTKLPNSFSN